MSINQSTLRVERELHDLTGQILDAQTRALVEAWVVAWGQVAAEVDAAALELASAARGDRVTRTMVIRSVRAQAALEAVAEVLGDVARKSRDVVVGDLLAVVRVAGAAEVDMIASQLTGVRRAELAAGLVRADPRQIAAMVHRATEQITALSWPVGVEASAAINRELLRGIAVGDNPVVVARRMVDRVEGRFNGGLARALVISRTETLSAMREAAWEADKANRDVLAGWTWLAHLDESTCRSCVAMHGQQFDVDVPGPYDHQQGRCARVPRTKSWEELGFSGIVDPPDLTPDADAWFDGLSADQQRGILGKSGFDAWQAGTYPRSAWATRRQNSGWRDSYVPSRPPGVAGRSGVGGGR